MDNQLYQAPHHSFECLLAAGATRQFQATAGQALDQLAAFHQADPDWLFGHLSYDLKNELYPLQSQHPDGIGFPDLFFFVPEYLLQLSETELRIGMAGQAAGTAEQVFNEIRNTALPDNSNAPATTPVSIHHRISRQDYLDTIRRLQQHILRGDCYELNFCQEFYAPDTTIQPLAAYRALSAASPNPFAAFYRLDHRYLLCASPERYLKKTGDRIWSQPIKGTARRDRNDPAVDEQNKISLQESSKERSENVMVVDLVRNDLSKVCTEGSVQVDELCAIYSFPQVHQMISTVSGLLPEGHSFVEPIRASFPMGSMTGAPKLRVMQLIEQYEQSRRGLFSGSVGYITPEGNIDFNVVIRSLLYNAATRYLSFPAGSAITFYSDPEQEYAECLLKAEAIQKVLQEL
ncbi:MAG: anthranilate synthase component I family protein [Candidatus Pseudobacter hemicellulosilyticus]|uniref:Anthranilate synthase component I family protein n=1 Tax=Candidatus Pseudobacter hemicellulosilyticus TaxID=3121375 RepID=A0AAJ6BIR2_9BACT|nr:MAG: anthranilate synthase component I family protein [Pseudobacter sp.]